MRQRGLFLFRNTLIVVLALALSACSVEQQGNGKVQMRLAGSQVGGPVSQAVCDTVAGFIGSAGGSLGATAFVAPMGNVDQTTKAGYILLGGLAGSIIGAVVGTYVCT